VRFSSGLRVPKAADFAIHPVGQDGGSVFPGHMDDAICIDAHGTARFFTLFIGH
jgi:hypothetical protein